MPTRRAVIVGGGVAIGTVALAGCLSDDDVEFSFEDVALIEGEPAGVGEYTEQPDATYGLGDDVWIYVEVVGAPTDDDGTARLEYTFETETPDGEEWEPVEREEEWSDADGDLLMIGQSIETFEDDEPGDYDLTIIVDDQVDGERLTTTETFTLE